jgi:hypothetical protein
MVTPRYGHVVKIPGCGYSTAMKLLSRMILRQFALVFVNHYPELAARDRYLSNSLTT